MSAIRQVLQGLVRMLAALWRAVKWVVRSWWGQLQKRESKTGKALVGCGGLFAVFVALGVLATLFTSSSATVTPTPQELAVVRAAATSTSEPTPIKTQAEELTNTPKPAATTLTQTQEPTSTTEPTKVVTRAEAAATATLRSTDTAAPVDTPTPKPTNTPQPATRLTNPPRPTDTPVPAAPTPVVSEDNIQILPNHSSYAAPGVEEVHVVGEVRNSTARRFIFSSIGVNFFDGSGNLVGTAPGYTWSGYGYANLNDVLPNSQTCFSAVWFDATENWSRYELVTPTTYEDSRIRIPVTSGLTVLNDSGSFEIEPFIYKVTGQVRNETDARVERVSVIATLYDTSSTVIGCEFDFIEEMEPSHTAPFEISFFDRENYADVGLYRLQVDGFLPAPSTTVGSPSSQTARARVARVIDGDTIEVEIDSQGYQVRYIGVDTPEQGEPFFAKATQANRELVEGQVVDLVKDVSDTDQYGRLLRYVYADNIFVNAMLVWQGYARVVTFPPDVKYEQLFLEFERDAREEGRGLWSKQADAVVVVSSLNVRRGPGTSYDRVGVVSQGDELDVTGRNSDASWLVIAAASGLTGWIANSSDFIELNVDPMQEAPLIPAPSTSTPVPTEPPSAPAQADVVISSLSGRSNPEVVVITNQGGAAQNLGGWRLHSWSPSGGCHRVDSQFFIFPDRVTLEPDASVRVFSASRAVATAPTHIVWTTQNIWNNDGDRAELFDASGNLVSAVGYGACR